MEIDKEKFIAAQAIAKSVVDGLSGVEDEDKFQAKFRIRFKAVIKIVEDYATVAPGDEWINSGVLVPKAYWDTRNPELIGEGNRPMKNEKTGRWEVWTQMKHIVEFKKMIEAREIESK